MRVPCPTCGRLGRVPKAFPVGAVIGYCGPNGERVPYETCQSCGGSGWVNDSNPARCDAEVATGATSDLMRKLTGHNAELNGARRASDLSAELGAGG